MIQNFLRKIKAGTEEEYYGREIIVNYVKKHFGDGETVKILDIGCGSGTDLINIKNGCSHLNAELHGIESYGPNIETSVKNGIQIADIDIENSEYPFENNSLDFVLANQVIEHTKEIFWIFSEISRILKPGGLLIIGVPNLASLHNRILLLLGRQPSSIKMLSAHVRGITRETFQEFIECDNYFELVEFCGAHFYPFPRSMGRKLARLFPGFAVGHFYVMKRTDKAGLFKNVLETRMFETPYYTGA